MTDPTERAADVGAEILDAFDPHDRLMIAALAGGIPRQTMQALMAGGVPYENASRMISKVITFAASATIHALNVNRYPQPGADVFAEIVRDLRKLVVATGVQLVEPTAAAQTLADANAVLDDMNADGLNTVLIAQDRDGEPDPDRLREIDIAGLVRDLSRLRDLLEPMDVSAVATKVTNAVCELPDRTSPEDQPDMLMVTVDELHLIVRRALGEDA